MMLWDDVWMLGCMISFILISRLYTPLYLRNALPYSSYLPIGGGVRLSASPLPIRPRPRIGLMSSYELQPFLHTKYYRDLCSSRAGHVVPSRGISDAQCRTLCKGVRGGFVNSVNPGTVGCGLRKDGMLLSFRIWTIIRLLLTSAA